MAPLSLEPLDPTHRTSKRHSSEAWHAAPVLLDSRRVALQQGLDWDVTDPDREVDVLDDDDDDDESSELINVFEQQHISLQPCPTNR